MLDVANGRRYLELILLPAEGKMPRYGTYLARDRSRGRRIVKHESIRAPQADGVRGRQRLRKFLQLILQVVDLFRLRLSPKKRLEPSGPPLQFLIEFVEQPVPQREPRKPSERSKNSAQHQRIPK